MLSVRSMVIYHMWEKNIDHSEVAGMVNGQGCQKSEAKDDEFAKRLCHAKMNGWARSQTETGLARESCRGVVHGFSYFFKVRRL